MDRPRAAPGGGWSADALTLEQVEVPGLSPLTLRRVVVTRPDLQAVARLLATFAQPAAAGRHDRQLEIERMAVHGLSRSAERRAGHEGVSTCSSRWSPSH